MNLTLRPYQTDIIRRLREAYRAGYHAPLLQSPTGSGKTVMFAYITDSASRRGTRVYILVHRQELIGQCSGALFGLNVPHGIIAPGRTMTHDLVQVASVQTLVRRLDRVPAPDLIIIDECHHTVAGSWRNILDRYPSANLMGVTATPVRLDGCGLGKQSGGFYDVIVNGPTVRELVHAGYLSQPVVYAPPTGIDVSGVHRRYGDFIRSELMERLDRPTITGCAVDHYRRLCPDAPAIAFCVSVAHAEHVAGQFNEAGIPSASIDGTLSDYERRGRIRDLASGAIRVLTSCEIISEGTDIPVVTAAILLRPTESMGLYLQQCGRALRPHPGKNESIILDHAGNTFRHGLPDDEREWTLDGEMSGKRITDESVPRVVQCERCYIVYSAMLRVCPSCGFERKADAREIEQIDGELQKVDAETVQRLRRREVGKARTLEQLQEIARERGYKPQWAHYVWQARQSRQGVLV